MDDDARDNTNHGPMDIISDAVVYDTNGSISSSVSVAVTSDDEEDEWYVEPASESVNDSQTIEMSENVDIDNVDRAASAMSSLSNTANSGFSYDSETYNGNSDNYESEDENIKKKREDASLDGSNRVKKKITYNNDSTDLVKSQLMSNGGVFFDTMGSDSDGSIIVQLSAVGYSEQGPLHSQELHSHELESHEEMLADAGGGDEPSSNSKYNARFQALNSLLDQSNMTLIDSPRDGNCLFEAMSFLIFNDASHHMIVRSGAVRFLTDFVDNEPELDLVDNEPELDLVDNEPEHAVLDGMREVNEDLQSYVRNMDLPDTWGGDPEIFAIANQYRWRIDVINENNEIITTFGNQFERKITIAFIDEFRHFVAVTTSDYRQLRIGELQEQLDILFANVKILVPTVTDKFKEIKEECKKMGLQPCARRNCCSILPIDGYFGYSGYCKQCWTTEGMQLSVKANQDFRQKHSTHISKLPAVMNTGAIEDDARDWLIGELAKLHIKSVVSLEFRKADFASKFESESPVAGQNPSQVALDDEKYVSLQLKACSALKKDGSAQTRFKFDGCMGYDNMIVVLIKSYHDGNDELKRHIWFANGSDIRNKMLAANKDNKIPLSNHRDPIMLMPSTVADLAEKIKHSKLPRRSLLDINFEVENANQRKEIMLMESLLAVGHRIEYIPGNQTSVDCVMDEIATQVKTYNIKKETCSNCSHTIKNHRGQPYTDEDGINMLLEGLIVQSNKKYYVIYAMQPLHDLLINGVFGHKEVYNGRPPASGKTSIAPPLNECRKWLKNEAPKRGRKENGWLNDSKFNWRIAEIPIDKIRFPRDWLDDVYVAKSPDDLPTKRLVNSNI